MKEIIKTYFNKLHLETIEEILILPKHSLVNTSVKMKHIMKVGDKEIVFGHIDVGMQETFGYAIGFTLFGINLNETHISVKKIMINKPSYNGSQTSQNNYSIIHFAKKLFKRKEK